ncbi:MAG: ATP-binding protein [Planctomycetota bacterium]|nr:ATP-binding protein [Planctomycetota bacterium]
MRARALGLLVLFGSCIPTTGEGEPGEPLIQIWLDSGVVLTRSPELTGDLPRSLARGLAPTADWVVLPDGRDARAVGLRLTAPTPLGPRPVDVVVARANTEQQRALAQLGGLLWIAWGAANVGVAGVLYLVVRRGLQPLDRLGGEIQALDVRRLDAHFSAHGAPDELRPVVNQLNDMVARLREAFEREHAFSAHAAHELRTPLTGLRTTLELALRRERSPEDYTAAAQNCLAMTLQLQQTVQSLLELARPTGPLGLQFEMVDLPAYVRKLWQALDRQSLTLETQSVGATEVRTDAALLERIVANLLSNAVSHAPAGSRLRCRIHSGARGARLLLANRAPELKPEDGPRTLQAFWRADRARSGTDQHSGLGLSLSSVAAERLEGQLRVRVSGGHFIARLSLTPGP